MTSLSKQLSFINQKNYEPVYSAKLFQNKLLKKRPKTCSNDNKNNTGNNDFNQNKSIRNSVSRSALSTRSSNLTSFSMTKKQETKLSTVIDNSFKNKSEKQAYTKDYDEKIKNEHDNMTNISLLTVNSYELIKAKKIYGTFLTFSHFERYMNRRAKVKLQLNLSPKLPAEFEDSPEPTLFDLLAEDELNRLYDMFKIEKAMPFRIRSKSVCFDRASNTSKLTITKSKKIRKINSLERLFDSKSIINSTQNEKETKSVMKKSEINTNPDDSFDENYEPDSNGRLIKGPKIYEMGRNFMSAKSARHDNSNDKKVLEIFDKEIKLNNHIKLYSKSYGRGKSKLSAYLEPNSNKSFSSFVNYSISALDRHSQTFTPFVKYQNKIVEKKSYVRMSDMLENKIRENLKMNRGPIYYGDFTEENIKLHNLNYNENDEINANEKFLNIFEWLNKIDVDECSHFYSNPFKQDKSNLTDDCNLNQNIEFNDKLKHKQMRFNKIDPFENPKNITERFVPTRKDRFLFGFNTYYDTIDKQTHIAKKDYRTLLNLEPGLFKKNKSEIIDLNEFKKESDVSEHISSNLKKQKIINDTYLTRMRLDLYIL